MSVVQINNTKYLNMIFFYFGTICTKIKILVNCTDNSMEDLWICILEEWDRRQGDKDPADLRELEKLVGKEKYLKIVRI